MDKKVKKIQKLIIPKKIKVAAYARVSLNSESMKHSVEAQIDYYTDMIKNNNEWEFVKVYSDFGKTGTKGNRPEFQQMLNDCRTGKIDLVITKSVSRFARNTVTLLKTVRELKNMGIDVYFEEQNIHTMNNDGEIMLTAVASYAQAESVSISENIKWRKRKDMSTGKTKPLKVYGYNVINGKLEINTEQEVVIKRIFNLYLSGWGCIKIAKLLESENILSPKGNKHWCDHTILRLLKNEKMRGNLLHQRQYVQDPIEKKQVANNGVLPMYLIEESHEPIIDNNTFEAVQTEIARRKRNGGFNEYIGIEFRKLITCDICGHKFIHTRNGIKSWVKPCWSCGGHDRRVMPDGCASKAIPEDILIKAVCEVLAIDKYDGKVVKDKILEIIACRNRILKIRLKDGNEFEYQWYEKKHGPKKKYEDGGVNYE